MARADENGVSHQRSKSFSPREYGSLDTSRAAAVKQRNGAVEIVKGGAAVLRSDQAARLTVGELFKEWIANHAAPNTGERYAKTRSEPGIGTSSRGSGESSSVRSRVIPASSCGS